MQELVAPAGAVGFVAAGPVTGTQELWQFMASVSQALVQVVKVGKDGGKGIVIDEPWGVGPLVMNGPLSASANERRSKQDALRIVDRA